MRRKGQRYYQFAEHGYGSLGSVYDRAAFTFAELPNYYECDTR
jgi:hypothetical protein